MKWIAVKLIMLVLVTAWVPCSDNDGCTSDPEHAQEAVHSVHDQEKPGDDCSPFCTCHCCHTHTLIAGKNMLTAVRSITKQPDHYSYYCPPEPVSSIFHPPAA